MKRRSRIGRDSGGQRLESRDSEAGSREAKERTRASGLGPADSGQRLGRAERAELFEATEQRSREDQAGLQRTFFFYYYVNTVGGLNKV